MPRELRSAPSFYNAGDKEPIPAGEFYETTVKSQTEVTVWDKKVNQDQVLFHGHGPADREFAEAFVNLDLQSKNNGAINGKVVLAITDSDQRRVLASTTFDSLEQLRAASNESRTNQIVEDALGPYANPGRYLEVRVEAVPGSDGNEIDASASSGQLYYSRVTR